jgi:hypothetical protein
MESVVYNTLEVRTFSPRRNRGLIEISIHPQFVEDGSCMTFFSTGQDYFSVQY